MEHFGEMLDLIAVAGEDEVLEPFRSEETIMRGRRRGRKGSSPQDAQDPGSQPPVETTGTGAVTLVETPPPSAPAPTPPPPPPPPPPAAAPVPADRGVAPVVQPQRRMRETISDVATAHAELDNVLPPPPKTSTVRSDAPVSGSVVTGEKSEARQRVSDTPVAPAPRPAEPAPRNEEPITPPADTASAGPRPSAPILADPEPQDAATSDPEVQSASGNALPRVLAVANQKGGVGKTTTSVNLGAALAELGFRVLVIDLDPQGNATTGLGIDARNFELSMYDVLMRESSMEDCIEPTSMKNLFVAPATIALAGAEIELVPAFSRELKLKKSIESVIDDFDYVLIDCPPSLGLITVNALAAADEVLVPIQCEYYALEGLSQLMRNVHLVASNLNPKLDISTIVLTMYDARTKLADQVANEVRLHFGPKVCRNVIPRTVRLSEAPSFGQPITAFDPASRGAIAYRELAKEVSGGTS